MVFVHGNPGSAADWRPLLESVSSTPSSSPDMPGFGGAEKRRDMDYTVAGYADHLGGIIDALGVERIHLVAHDSAARGVLTWAAANVDRLASVSLPTPVCYSTTSGTEWPRSGAPTDRRDLSGFGHSRLTRALLRSTTTPAGPVLG